MADSKLPLTTFTILDVQTVESGETAGNLVISIEAHRKGKSYKLPYHITKENIPSISVEYLRQKVVADVDSLESQANKELGVVTELTSLIGTPINAENG